LKITLILNIKTESYLTRIESSKWHVLACEVRWIQVDQSSLG